MQANWLSEPQKTGFFTSGMEYNQEVVKKAVEEQPGVVSFSIK